MGKELGKIIRYFFSHDVSDGLRKRVYKRITMPGETDAVTDEMRKIWDDQNVVVTRCFGGKHLGGDRFRHVLEAVRIYLERSARRLIEA